MPGEGGVVQRSSGRALSITGVVLAFLISPVGLIISIVAMVKARRSGTGNGLALAGIIVGLLGTAILVVGAFVVMSLVPNFIELTEQCQGLASGAPVEVNGAKVQCP
ncbi:DUF4190 domain-containing protein [Arthrobacter sp. MSA 4-2]|uniref:DUF4190 domain-containing protein n=1 Tax=Arthrobacter sp. MSA 4-2 TaxID=2794349 RepID=UPI0018E6DF7A|nr:DUF4190 domain-containing protein [Arthrobacter sp. MSA 4-2]MBJ2122422.1 DUF4190 domain-containing protein [Arthrobacter sp. MSA 4-2]